MSILDYDYKEIKENKKEWAERLAKWVEHIRSLPNKQKSSSSREDFEDDRIDQE